MAGEVFRQYPTLWVRPPSVPTLPVGGGSVPWTGPRAVFVPRSTDLTPTWLPPPSIAALMPVGGGSVPWRGPRPVDPADALIPPQTQDLRPTFLPPPSIAALMPPGGGSVPWTGPRPVDPADDLTPPQTQDLRPTFLPPPSIAALMPPGGGVVRQPLPPVTIPRTPDYPYWIAADIGEYLAPLVPLAAFVPPASMPAIAPVAPWYPQLQPRVAFLANLPAGGGAVPWTGPRPVDPADDLMLPQTQDLRPTFLPPPSIAALMPLGGGAVPGANQAVTAPRSAEFPYWIAGELSEFTIVFAVVPGYVPPAKMPDAAWQRPPAFDYALETELSDVYNEGYFDQTAFVPSASILDAAILRPDPPLIRSSIGVQLAPLIPPPAPYVPTLSVPSFQPPATWLPQITVRASFQTLLPAGGGNVPPPVSPVVVPRSPDYPYWTAAGIGVYIAPLVQQPVARVPAAPIVTAPRSAEFPYWIAGELAEYLIPTVTDRPFAFAIDRQAAAHRRDPWFAPLVRAFFPPPSGVIAPPVIKARITFDLRDQRLTPTLRSQRIDFEFRDRRLTAERRGDA